MTTKPPERVRDLLELAIADEVRARDLYATWRARASDPDLARALADLEADEERHRAMLETMRTVHAGLPMAEGSIAAPLPRWAERPLTTEPRDLRELLAFAVRDEHEAYLRYFLMAEAAPSPKIREACRTLADEETAHQRKLEAWFRRLFPTG